MILKKYSRVSIFKHDIKNNSGLRFIYENLKISSVLGRNYLLNTKFITEKDQIEESLNTLSQVHEFISKNLKNSDILDLSLRMHQFNDISGTIKNLEDHNIVLDDVQLFEVKKFAVVLQQIISKLRSWGFNVYDFADMSEMIKVLDPENSRDIGFYIYSVYDDKLRELRRQQTRIEDSNQEKIELIRLQCIKIEDEIRARLTKKIQENLSDIKSNYEKISRLDLEIAKSLQIAELSLVKPSIADGENSFKALFNPYFVDSLAKKAKKYQAIDVQLKSSPVLITGANMSGKTVLLKTLALAQQMFQYGFYVPAERASLNVFDKVLQNIGEISDELNGLSSFAVEMRNVNTIISEVKAGARVLALVDELARTTNPDEGKAIVSAFVSIMQKYNVMSVITTHFGGVKIECRRLRVRGLQDVVDFTSINEKNINDYIDYSLFETNEDEVPCEAISVAEILGNDAEFIAEAKRYVNL